MLVNKSHSRPARILFLITRTSSPMHPVCGTSFLPAEAPSLPFLLPCVASSPALPVSRCHSLCPAPGQLSALALSENLHLPNSPLYDPPFLAPLCQSEGFTLRPLLENSCTGIEHASVPRTPTSFPLSMNAIIQRPFGG